jgi:predicted metal-dependent peptidase
LHNPVIVDNAADYLAEVNHPFRSGGTDFNPCFDYIRQQVNAAPAGSSFYIIFLTDG